MLTLIPKSNLTLAEKISTEKDCIIACQRNYRSNVWINIRPFTNAAIRPVMSHRLPITKHDVPKTNTKMVDKAVDSFSKFNFLSNNCWHSQAAALSIINNDQIFSM